jgi:hypothetical protein
MAPSLKCGRTSVFQVDSTIDLRLFWTALPHLEKRHLASMFSIYFLEIQVRKREELVQSKATKRTVPQ